MRQHEKSFSMKSYKLNVIGVILAAIGVIVAMIAAAVDMLEFMGYTGKDLAESKTILSANPDTVHTSEPFQTHGELYNIEGNFLSAQEANNLQTNNPETESNAIGNKITMEKTINSIFTDEEQTILDQIEQAYLKGDMILMHELQSSPEFRNIFIADTKKDNMMDLYYSFGGTNNDEIQISFSYFRDKSSDEIDCISSSIVFGNMQTDETNFFSYSFFDINGNILGSGITKCTIINGKANGFFEDYEIDYNEGIAVMTLRGSGIAKDGLRDGDYIFTCIEHRSDTIIESVYKEVYIDGVLQPVQSSDNTDKLLCSELLESTDKNQAAKFLYTEFFLTHVDTVP